MTVTTNSFRAGGLGRGGLATSLALVSGIVVELLVVAAVPVFYTVDGATHLGGAFSLGQLITGAAGPFGRYLQLDWFPTPNTSPELLLALLLRGLDQDLAAKILMAGYIVALPLAMVYAVRGVRPASAWIALFALPLTFTLTFEYGFYNYSYATAGFLVVAGFVARHRREVGGRNLLLLGALLLLVYSMHMIPFAEALLFLGTVALWDAIADWRSRRSIWPALRAHVVPAALAAAPSTLLLLVFMARTGVDEPGRFMPIVSKLAAFLSLAMPLATFDTREVVVTSVLALTILALGLAAAWRRWRGFVPTDADAYLAFAVVASAVYVVAPSDSPSGGSFLLPRLALFPVYGALLWIAAHAIGVRWRRVGAAAALVVAVALTVLRLPEHAYLSRLVRDYTSVAPCLAHEATMIQVSLARADPGSLRRTDPMIAETGRLSSLTDGLDLDNVDASVPFYLIRYRPETDPFLYLQTNVGVFNSGFQTVPPVIDPIGYEQRTGGRVDYVLVFGRVDAESSTLASPQWARLRSELEAGYRRVAVSAMQLLEVWERDETPAAAAGVQQRARPEAAACRVNS